MISTAVIEDVENLQFKISQNFLEISQNFMSKSYSASIYKKKYCGKKFNTHGRYCGTCPKRIKGSKRGSYIGRTGPRFRSSPGHLRLNSSSDGFFKQASSEHSLLTQKILLEIRRNTTLIPPGYHTNTHINVP